MPDHFTLDVDPEAVSRAATRLGELGDHLTERGRTTGTAPERWAAGWHGRAATAVGGETTTLSGHLTDFAADFHGAKTGTAGFARELEHAQDVELPDLNRRWQAAQDDYEAASGRADAARQRARDEIKDDVTPQVRRMILMDLDDSRGSAVNSAYSAKTRAEEALQVEYDDLVDRLDRHARRLGGEMAGLVAVPVPAAVVNTYQLTRGNTLGQWVWGIGGDFLTDLSLQAEQTLGGPLAELRDKLRNPPDDYAEIQALLEEARALGLPPDQYAETLKEYWYQRSGEVAGIDLADWDPSKGADYNRETIEAVYRYYGDLYLDNPDLQWAGMANMIGPSFAAGFFDLALFRKIGGAADNLPGPLRDALPPGVADLSHLTEEDLRFFETAFLDMQKQIFRDQGGMHQAYADGGLPAIEEMLAAGIIDPETAESWRGIASGDPDRVQAGNEQFLLREQRDIIDDDYQRMYDHDPTGPAMTWAMTLIGAPSIPGAQGYADVFPLHVEFETPGPENIPLVGWDNPTQGSVDITTPFPDGNIANFDDRWALIEQDTLPTFQEFLDSDPEGARDLIGADVGDRIEEYRIYHHIDDIIGQMLDWDVDVDQ